MKVRNVHERILPNTEQVEALIDSLATKEDALWPTEAWPRMVFDRPLGVGAVGGHGPVRYCVEAYEPGKSIRFRFIAPKGFRGWHGYEIGPAKQGFLSLRHTLEMSTSGLAVLSWPMIFRPLHDALIEDS
ncbi:MAG: SRPBCC family protein, partial [Marinobacter sp.]|nr:SRPBCC family protein [Marinobacter sp.]